MTNSGHRHIDWRLLGNTAYVLPIVTGHSAHLGAFKLTSNGAARASTGLGNLKIAWPMTRAVYGTFARF
eukprot:6193056-Pleurochrysis_carterae.AAC.2